MTYDMAHRLADDIRHSEEYETYHGLRDEVMGDATQSALIHEYKRLQMQLQVSAMNGGKADDTDMQRFSALSTLLFTKDSVRDYLLAEMRLQQALGDIFRILTEAADIDLGLDGLGGN